MIVVTHLFLNVRALVFQQRGGGRGGGGGVGGGSGSGGNLDEKPVNLFDGGAMKVSDELPDDLFENSDGEDDVSIPRTQNPKFLLLTSNLAKLRLE